MVTHSSPTLEKEVCIVGLILGIAIVTVCTGPLIILNQFPGKVLALSTVNATTNQNISNTTNTINNNRTQTIAEPAPSKIEPMDLNPHNLTADMVKKDLSRLTPDEIAKYHLKDLSSENLGIILGTLPISDLEKTLNNIKADDLREILNKLPQDKVDQILTRLPQDKVDQILSRISPLS
jgi:Mg/Co/Ni transporter MgtE